MNKNNIRRRAMFRKAPNDLAMTPIISCIDFIARNNLATLNTRKVLTLKRRVYLNIRIVLKAESALLELPLFRLE